MEADEIDSWLGHRYDQECEVRILKAGEAINLYNELKREGKKVAIHVHSTC